MYHFHYNITESNFKFKDVLSLFEIEKVFILIFRDKNFYYFLLHTLIVKFVVNRKHKFKFNHTI